ncbi:MAG: putative manganese transporter [Lachnospiraceae bacterium]|nr:putative manganese transporter [Lachnospiraceae bacterium]
MILDCLLDSLIDSIKLLPFLFITYYVMEYLEHKAGSKMQYAIKKAGKSGPLIGGVLGAFPQCGFSAAASNLYAGKIITIGTLIAVYLSTSDEMLPIMISNNAGVAVIGKFLIVKILIGMIAGFVIDFVFRKKSYEQNIHHICEEHHCHCEEGILKSAIHHTLEIFIYILIISFVLNIIIGVVGEDTIQSVISNKPFIGGMISGLIGLIPNCAGSVVITELFLNGVISFGVALSGLLAGSGVGILVLFRVNDDIKENIKILLITYIVSVIVGFIVGLVF